MAKYHSVNGAWPEGTDDGRALKPTPEEALRGAKRLYRVALKRPFRGKMRLTSGRRYTAIRRGVFYVNPDEQHWSGGGGWHEIVHSISHIASGRLFPRAKGHGPQHAFLERELITHVVNSGWLEGKLRRQKQEKPPVDAKEVRAARVAKRIKAWEAKRRRAETALKKLRRTATYYERQGVQA